MSSFCLGFGLFPHGRFVTECIVFSRCTTLYRSTTSDPHKIGESANNNSNDVGNARAVEGKFHSTFHLFMECFFLVWRGMCFWMWMLCLPSAYMLACLRVCCVLFSLFIHHSHTVPIQSHICVVVHIQMKIAFIGVSETWREPAAMTTGHTEMRCSSWIMHCTHTNRLSYRQAT